MAKKLMSDDLPPAPGGRVSELPPRVRTAASRILASAARRILAEEFDGDAVAPASLADRSGVE